MCKAPKPKRIVQIYKKTTRTNQIKIWGDTVWDSAERARLAHPEEFYRTVEVVEDGKN